VRDWNRCSVENSGADVSFDTVFILAVLASFTGIITEDNTTLRSGKRGWVRVST